MNDSQAISRSARLKWIIGGSLGGLLAVAVVGFFIYSSVCPCDRTPGGFLLGEAAAGPVSDWSFANDVPLCQLQIYAGIRPHSVNLNCFATPEGEMYLSCSVCDSKYWASKVEANESSVMKLDGITYPVVLNRVQDPARMDHAWAARVIKLQTHGGGPFNPIPDLDAVRPDHWWTYHVTWRG